MLYIYDLFSNKSLVVIKHLSLPVYKQYIILFLIFAYNLLILLMKIEWKLKAIKQIKRIPRYDQVRILSQVDSLENGIAGKTNIIKMANHRYAYRMRVGSYRVLFNILETVEIISIEEVRKRDERTYSV
jgi:mRNA-degrading endonuclease RelE of RelBE toxin-antitoxin system